MHETCKARLNLFNQVLVLLRIWIFGLVAQLLIEGLIQKLNFKSRPVSPWDEISDERAPIKPSASPSPFAAEKMPCEVCDEPTVRRGPGGIPRCMMHPPDDGHGSGRDVFQVPGVAPRRSPARPLVP